MGRSGSSGNSEPSAWALSSVQFICKAVTGGSTHEIAGQFDSLIALEADDSRQTEARGTTAGSASVTSELALGFENTFASGDE